VLSQMDQVKDGGAIVVDLDTDQRRCVSCGFTDDRPVQGASAGQASAAGPVREVTTRVSRAAARRVETPAQPVTLIDPDQPEN
jgi:hypothetical protein